MTLYDKMHNNQQKKTNIINELICCVNNYSKLWILTINELFERVDFAFKSSKHQITWYQHKTPLFKVIPKVSCPKQTPFSSHPLPRETLTGCHAACECCELLCATREWNIYQSIQCSAISRRAKLTFRPGGESYSITTAAELGGEVHVAWN